MSTITRSQIARWQRVIHELENFVKKKMRCADAPEAVPADYSSRHDES